MRTAVRPDLLRRIADLSPPDFPELALDVFRYQAAANPLYTRYLALLGRDPAGVEQLTEIPFLPIQLFKQYEIKTGEWAQRELFTSSGTTGQRPSRHFVRDPDFYRANARRGFEHFYGPVADWCVLALLPAYLERTGSSLVAMADDFIRRSRHPESGFFLHDLEKLTEILQTRRASGAPTLLLGVSFALLDLAERHPMDLSGITVMETGGMKGRRRELTRPELHAVLQEAFHLEAIHSEYGMTELLSQAYTRGEPFFTPAPTLRFLTTELQDPFQSLPPGRTGILNAIDLANLDTCAFIATEDLGRVYADGRFEVLGRADAAELRGCNLMVE